MKRVAIIGAGVSGLFIANLFKNKVDYQITVYEKNNLIDLEKGYGLQLSVNSIKLLNKIGFDKLNINEKFTPKKINFYSNKSLDKICDLDITKFNSGNCKYTTLKRSTLIDFLKKDLENHIKIGYDISKIKQQNNKINLYFENNDVNECDYLIISDGVFSKTKNLISNNKTKPVYNGTIAIRGILTKSTKNIDRENVSLFLDSNFHQVIYPTNPHGELNFIAIIKYKLSIKDQRNLSLFNDKHFVDKVIKKIPSKNKEFLDNLKELKIFPVFVSKNFFKLQNDKIYTVGDAFFAFPPSFAQGASQSIESAYELFKSIENNTEKTFFKTRMNKIKMVNTRSKFNQFAFHLSNPLTTFLRNIFLKRLVKNKKFLNSYLGKVYRG